MLDQSSIQNHSINKARTSLRPLQFVTGKDPTASSRTLLKQDRFTFTRLREGLTQNPASGNKMRNPYQLPSASNRNNCTERSERFISYQQTYSHLLGDTGFLFGSFSWIPGDRLFQLFFHFIIDLVEKGNKSRQECDTGGNDAHQKNDPVKGIRCMLHICLKSVKAGPRSAQPISSARITSIFWGGDESPCREQTDRINFPTRTYLNSLQVTTF